MFCHVTRSARSVYFVSVVNTCLLAAVALKLAFLRGIFLKIKIKK